MFTHILVPLDGSDFAEAALVSAAYSRGKHRRCQQQPRVVLRHYHHGLDAIRPPSIHSDSTGHSQRPGATGRPLRQVPVCHRLDRRGPDRYPDQGRQQRIRCGRHLRLARRSLRAALTGRGLLHRADRLFTGRPGFRLAAHRPHQTELLRQHFYGGARAGHGRLSHGNRQQPQDYGRTQAWLAG